MTDAVLRKLIEEASEMVDAFFEPTGQMLAHILAISPDGKRQLLACPMADVTEEEFFRVKTPALLRRIGFQRWCFFTEAWTAPIRQGELPADRPDRMEIVTFVAERQGLDRAMVASRQIYRTKPDGPGKLLPLVFPKGNVAFVMGPAAAAGAAR